MGRRKNVILVFSRSHSFWCSMYLGGGGMSHTGVNKSGERWVSAIWVKDKCIHLGTFDDEEEATKVRIKAEEKYQSEGSYQPLKAGELKIINERVAKALQKLICSRWSKTKFNYEPHITYGV